MASIPSNPLAEALGAHRRALRALSDVAQRLADCFGAPGSQYVETVYQQALTRADTTRVAYDAAIRDRRERDQTD